MRLLPFLVGLTLMTFAANAQDRPPVAIAIHGGAGTLGRGDITPEQDAEYRAALETALRAGEQVLLDGGSAMDAVEATIVTMENSPLFNAGKGAVLTAEGKAELDASVMDGGTGQAGAIASVTTIKNPIKLARLVMERSGHVLLVSDGAETFADETQVERVENDYFLTDRRREALERLKEQEATQEGRALGIGEGKFGTVGCVALDAEGNLAAGTSTGGLSNKRFGRVGDSPIVGAGTWADARVAVSCTGQGEYFIRLGIARDLAARVAYLDESASDSATAVIDGLTTAGGLGGLVGMGADGTAFYSFNTEGMYRGHVARDGTLKVAIYEDEQPE